ncbi:MAG: ParA family protein [Prosthecobacter sp.]
MSKIITLYNNKGGVSKTTTLFNLAVYLSKAGKKVLIADCDPQCNATELFFASSIYDDPDKELTGTSIYEALKPRFYGEVAKVDVKSVQVVESARYKKLFLLRGDLEFASAERYFANAINQAITENIHEKNTYLALSRLLTGLINMHNFDYILCDVGPSAGAITQMVVLCCDAFFLPLLPDRFSNQAVQVLGHILTEWIKRHQETARTFEPFGMEVFKGDPVFLGAIIQNYKVHSDGIKKSYDRWRKKIAASIADSILKQPLIKKGTNIKGGEGFVASIKDVGPLAPTAQLVGRAIFDIRQEDTEFASSTGQKYYGAVWDNWVERKKDYHDEIRKLAALL